ncbi:MAG TPA: MCE family protein [Nocardioides sp.]|nr:MCE family protein [Nocardioides sp.]
MSVRDMTDARKVRVAVVGLVLIGVTLALAMNLQRLPLVGGGETYYAEFADAAGLQVGEEVRVAGVKVGKVTGMSLDGAKVRVAFLVQDVELGRDTTAGIEVKTLLGQHYLSVTPAGTKAMDEGATIPLARTTTPVNLVPAFQELTTRVQEIDTDQVAKAFDALAETLRATAPEMTGTLRGLTRLSQSISTRDVGIRELFSRANQVSGAVAARDTELAELLTSSDQVMQTLAARRQVVTQVIRGTLRLSRQLSGLVRDNDKAFAGTLTKLDAVLKILKANRGNIDQTMKYGAAYAREFTNVGGSGHWFDATLKFPRGYALCLTQSSDPALASAVGGALAQLNQGVNGDNQPCLPLGPAGGKP